MTFCVNYGGGNQKRGFATFALAKQWAMDNIHPAWWTISRIYD